MFPSFRHRPKAPYTDYDSCLLTINRQLRRMRIVGLHHFPFGATDNEPCSIRRCRRRKMKVYGIVMPGLPCIVPINGNCQIAAIRALLVPAPSIGFVLVIERVLKADVLARDARRTERRARWRAREHKFVSAQGTGSGNSSFRFGCHAPGIGVRRYTSSCVLWTRERGETREPAQGNLQC